MKITEIEWGTGKTYVDQFGLVWVANMYDLLSLEKKTSIRRTYYLKELVLIEFEERVDWSRIEIDTPIIVKMHYEIEWSKRHFAKFEKGTVFAYQNGKTSWTNEKSLLSSWDNAKLGDAK